jgi:hypothetical protein
MTPPVGQIYQITFNQSLDGQTMQNVVHFQERTGGSTNAQIGTSANLFLAALSLLQTTAVVYDNIVVKQMTPVAFDEFLVTPTTASGQNSSAVFNNTVAMVFTKRTGTAGKTHRGRMYVGGIPTIFATDPNKLNLTGEAATGVFTASIMNTFGLSGTDAHLCIGVYSRTLGGSHPFTLAGFQILSDLPSQLIFGNQRRRRVGVGI